ncbi:MAG: isoprenylcysteine carboxylmethyltransferase family protein [Candidatus Thermoplasmatota archaeon]|nr:isoprenylcysteine carboxylmethyltransferase family protein [Candidatus Thermoplasmatota archaeon]
MLVYLICAAVCAVIWAVNGKWIAEGVKEHMPSEIYMHTGLALVFTLLVCELTVGNEDSWRRGGLSWLSAVGFALYIPSAILVATALHDLKHKGEATGGDPTASTVFIDEGIYGVVRQPLTLGMAVWSVALLFVFQSLFSVLLGFLAILLFWLSARSEFEHNVAKFGDAYAEYAKRVPMWNMFRSVRVQKRDPQDKQDEIR